MFSRRKTKWTSIAVLLILLVLAAGCGARGGASIGSNTVEADTSGVALGVEDVGSTIELAKGQILIITLESNPSTGYRWEVVESDDAVLQQVGEVEFEVSDPRDPPPPGAGGTEVFRFEARGAGEVTLKLVYHRSWEEDVEPLETFSVQVIGR